MEKELIRQGFNVKEEFERLSCSVKSELIAHMKSVHFKKNEIILKEGEICYGIFYIKKGCCRNFFMNGSRDITTSIALDGQLIFSSNSSLNEQEAIMYIQALEDTNCLFIEHDAIKDLLSTNLEFNDFIRRATSSHYKQMSEMLNTIRALSALERYEYFIEEMPILIQRVPLQYLASFLGMSKETLSRMRSQI